MQARGRPCSRRTPGLREDDRMTERFLHDDPGMPAAWGPWFSHEYITYFALMGVPEIMHLKPVQVMPNPRLHDGRFPINPDHVDLYKEEYREVRRLDPSISFDYAQRNGEFSTEPPVQKSIEPWKILVIYSTEPDLLPDCGLDLHPYQKITGGSHGWRHMQFRLPGLTIGMAPESFCHHIRLAHKAFEIGNHYWGWRFLSRAAHYLADLGHPFHVKAAPPVFLLRHLLSARRMVHMLSAIHTGYEVYSEQRFRQGFAPFGDALITGAGEGRASGADVHAELDGYIRRARRRLNPIFRLLVRRFGPGLIDAYASVDPGGGTDVAAQTRACSADAARVFFREPDIRSLAYLDAVTTEILEDVGRMLGMLFAGFARAPAGRTR